MIDSTFFLRKYLLPVKLQRLKGLRFNPVADTKLDLNIGGSLPGETLVTEIIRGLATRRTTMSVENRDEWDRIELALAKGWINWWAERGLGVKV
jgi:hypothetical protein